MHYQNYDATSTTTYHPSDQGSDEFTSRGQNQGQNQGHGSVVSDEQKKPYKINISQILVDFKNTIASIGAPSDVEQKVYEYVSMVEAEAKKEQPRSASIVTHLKTASKILDDYISSTLRKPSNVVQDWIDAFLLQEVDYKADQQKASISASQQIEEQIEQTNPELKKELPASSSVSQNNQGFGGLTARSASSGASQMSAAQQYNQFRTNASYGASQAKPRAVSEPANNVEKQAPVAQSRVSAAPSDPVPQNNVSEKAEAKPKRRLKLAKRNGDIVQGGQVIAKKADDGKTYTAKEIEENPLIIKKVERPAPLSRRAKKKKHIAPKREYVSRNATVQKFYEKAKEYLNKGEARKALESYRKTLNYAKKSNDKRAQACIIQDMGESYNKLNNLPKAAKCFYKASKRTKDCSVRAVSHHSLGSVYDEVGNFDLAMDHYFESLTLNGIGDNSVKQAKTLSNIGLMHAGKYQSKEAIEFYKLALTMAKQQETDVSMMGEVLGNTAEVFKSMGKPHKALKYYQKSIICEQRVDNKEAKAKTYEKAADLMLSMNRVAKAKSLYKKAVQEALLSKDSEQVKLINKKISLLEQKIAA